MSQNDDSTQYEGIEIIRDASVFALTAFEAKPFFIAPNPIAGASSTVPAKGQIGRVALTNASSIATYTLNLPSTSFDGHTVELYSLGGVQALTVTPSATSMYLGAAPTAVTAGKSVKFYWSVSLGKWIVSA